MVWTLKCTCGVYYRLLGCMTSEILRLHCHCYYRHHAALRIGDPTKLHLGARLDVRGVGVPGLMDTG